MRAEIQRRLADALHGQVTWQSLEVGVFPSPRAEVGRYRDRAMVAAQAEYRFPLTGRWGGVVFGGWGTVAPAFSEMGDQPDLPSIGFGVRWLAAEKARVNVSLDVARGRDATAFYVYVKESF